MARLPHGFDAAHHEKHHWWRALLLRLALCIGVSALLWWASGWPGLLVSVVNWGYVLGRDLVELGETVLRGLRQLAFRPVQGQFYQFKGHRIRVAQDEVEAQRWIAMDDLDTALGSPVPRRTLSVRTSDARREMLDLRDGKYWLDDAALNWLRTQRSDRAARLAVWVEREIWYPARGRKASYKQKEAPGLGQGAPHDD